MNVRQKAIENKINSLFVCFCGYLLFEMMVKDLFLSLVLKLKEKMYMKHSYLSHFLCFLVNDFQYFIACHHKAVMFPLA